MAEVDPGDETFAALVRLAREVPDVGLGEALRRLGGLSEEQRTVIEQTMGHIQEKDSEMTWEIAGRGEEIEFRAAADLAEVWRWSLRTAIDEAVVDVRISDTAKVQFDLGTLRSTRASHAIRTAGGSEIERMLDEDQLPRYVNVSDGGCSWIWEQVASDG